MDMLSKNQLEKSIYSYNSVLEVVDTKDISGRARRTYLIQTKKGNNLVGYFCVNSDNEERFSKEEKVLELVNEKTNIPTQKILFSDFSKEHMQYYYYLSDEIKGFDPQPRYKYMSRGFKKNYIRQLGKYLGELHREIKFDNAGRLRKRGDTLKIESAQKWKDFLRQMTLETIDEFEKLFQDLQPQAKAYLKKNIEILGNEQPCLVHWDVKPDNTVVKDGEIQAVVDWEKAISGDKIWDLEYSRVQLIHRWFKTDSICQELEKQLFEGYREENKLEKGWRKRRKFYEVLQLFDGMKSFSEFTEDQDMSKEEKEQVENFLRNTFLENKDNISR